MGVSPLMFAAKGGCIEAAELLLSGSTMFSTFVGVGAGRCCTSSSWAVQLKVFAASGSASELKLLEATKQMCTSRRPSAGRCSSTQRSQTRPANNSAKQTPFGPRFE